MDLQTILTEIIAVDTTSSRSNVALVELIESYFRNSDVVCYRQETHEKGKENLLLIKGEPSTNGLTLCGHLDTVPFTGEWQSDPLTLTERDGNWFARGACDMKGFVAIAIKSILEAQVRSGCLAVLLLCDEELGSFGAKYVLDLGLPVPIPKQVIIGEPTSLKVVRMHKGHLSIQISIHGQSAHTGAPHLGKNAVIVAAEVVTALAALGAEYEQKQTASSQFFPEITSFPVLSVATIEGGSAINVVPDLCKLGVGLRLLPDQEEEEVIKELKSTIDDSCDLPWELEILGNNPTMLTQEEVQINRWLCNNIGQEESYGVSFGTDGGFLSKADFQCVLYGAGDIAVAHKPDEFVPVKEMETCSRTIDAAITHFCGELS